jgi:ParD-like antitoxin of type II bacterial toxin-antitoxin system
MSASRSIRLDAALVEAAEVQGKALHRSAPSQIEFWASIGRRLAPVLSHKDLLAIGQGIARISIETEPSVRVDPDEVFAAVAQHRNTPFVSTAANPAPFQYESSQTPGCIDRIDADGSRVTGKMVDGQFVPQ